MVKCDNTICKHQIDGKCVTEDLVLETPSYQDAVESPELICMNFEYVDAEVCACCGLPYSNKYFAVCPNCIMLAPSKDWLTNI